MQGRATISQGDSLPFFSQCKSLRMLTVVEEAEKENWRENKQNKALGSFLPLATYFLTMPFAFMLFRDGRLFAKLMCSY